MYKPPGGKWSVVTNDFDEDFGGTRAAPAAAAACAWNKVRNGPRHSFYYGSWDPADFQACTPVENPYDSACWNGTRPLYSVCEAMPPEWGAFWTNYFLKVFRVEFNQTLKELSATSGSPLHKDNVLKILAEEEARYDDEEAQKAPGGRLCDFKTTVAAYKEWIPARHGFLQEQIKAWGL